MSEYHETGENILNIERGTTQWKILQINSIIIKFVRVTFSPDKTVVLFTVQRNDAESALDEIECPLKGSSSLGLLLDPFLNLEVQDALPFHLV